FTSTIQNRLIENGILWLLGRAPSVARQSEHLRPVSTADFCMLGSKRHSVCPGCQVRLSTESRAIKESQKSIDYGAGRRAALVALSKTARLTVTESDEPGDKLNVSLKYSEISTSPGFEWPSANRNARGNSSGRMMN